MMASCIYLSKYQFTVNDIVIPKEVGVSRFILSLNIPLLASRDKRHAAQAPGVIVLTFYVLSGSIVKRNK